MPAVESGPSTIRITPQDLAQLEHGTLGSSQRQWLQRQRLVFILGTVGFVLVLLLLAVLLAYYWRPSSIPGSVIVGAFAFGLVWLFLLRRAPRQWLYANRDLRAGEVALVDGQVHRAFRLTFGIFPFLKYSIRVGQRSWSVSQEVFEQFSDRGRYRIFYAPASDVFLGAVVLPLPDSLTPQSAQAKDEEDSGPPLLTPQEIEILRLIASGSSNKEIARTLSLSVNTIKMYASQIYRKLGVRRRTEAVAEARRIGLL